MHLSLVIPVGPNDHTKLEALLASIDLQAFPKEQLEVLLQFEGNSEEARAKGIARARGTIIGCLDADNVLWGHDFLHVLTAAAGAPDVTGAYPAYYAYFRTDPALNRYFALLGANDPLCWWLGKADRLGYTSGAEGAPPVHVRRFRYTIPTLGTNGFFVKATLAKPHVNRWALSHIEGCEAMREAGHSTYAIVDKVIHHRTGDSLWAYLDKRRRYLDAYGLSTKRKWRMVNGPADCAKVALFGIASVCILPHLLMAAYYSRRVRDPAWLLHPVVCLLLTSVYTWAMIKHGYRRVHRALHLPAPGGLSGLSCQPGPTDGEEL